MSSSQAPVVDRIRIIPRPTDFLDRNVGSSGEIFFSKSSNTLRVYSGKDTGGFEIARSDLTNVTTAQFQSASSEAGIALADLTNIDNTVFADKITASGFEGGGGASVDVGDTVPTSPEQGNIWFNSTNGQIYVYVTDTDSSQWIQPSYPLPILDWANVQNKPTIPISLLDLGISDGSSGQVLTTNGSGAFSFTTVTGGGGGGGGTSYNQSLNTTDDVTFDEITATTISADSITSTGVGTPGITSASSINLTAPDAVNVSNDISVAGDISITGIADLAGTRENVQLIVGATGVVTHDFSISSLWQHTSSAANFTADITNVPTDDNKSISIAVVITQGSTPYLPTALQVDGVAQTILWQGGSAPSGTASQTDIVGFTLLRLSSSWIVYGSLNTYA